MAGQAATIETQGSIESTLAGIIDDHGAQYRDGKTILPGLALSGLFAQDPEQTRSFKLEDLGFDSLDTLEIVMAIEDHYSIHISDDDYERELYQRPLSDITGYVQRRLAEPQ